MHRQPLVHRLVAHGRRCCRPRASDHHRPRTTRSSQATFTTQAVHREQDSERSSDLFQQYADRSVLESANRPVSDQDSRFAPHSYHDGWGIVTKDNEKIYTGKTLKNRMDNTSVTPRMFQGYVTSIRKANALLAFVQLVDPYMTHSIQLVVSNEEAQSPSSTQPTDQSEKKSTGVPTPWAVLKELRPHTPVEVRGVIQNMTGNTRFREITDPYVGLVTTSLKNEVRVESIRVLNEFPSSLVAKSKFEFQPEQRHLQFRTDSTLRKRLRQRSYATTLCRKALFGAGFDEIETPILFKSTPEGAREFIVPSRRKGMAYALPQSPQQYKQILMASGVYKYFQFARCFRDEDLRSDRQPEFTQLDMEVAFKGPEWVMNTINTLFTRMLVDQFLLQYPQPMRVPWKRESIYLKQDMGNADGSLAHPSTPHITYADAMRYYGSDKPDLRIPGHIYRVEELLPENLKGMMTSLQNPVVEAFYMRPNAGSQTPASSQAFLQSFMESHDAQVYAKNPEGMPGIAIVDSQRPVQGLAAFGHEAAEKIIEELELVEGDILVLQARPDKPFHGAGSTVVGSMRRDMFKAAVEAGIRLPSDACTPLWVVDFPLFSPVPEGEVSRSGICSTHHPFTSPVPTIENLKKLKTAPLEVIGDHFDLVINGIEVGGGSRRIHDADMQEYIFRGLLQLPEERIADFSHLLKALRDGCPPHAGFAIGFDRLMTILTRTESVRDVIAFPKSGDGVDRFVNSPSPLTEEQLQTYHLSILKDTPEAEIGQEQLKISMKA